MTERTSIFLSYAGADREEAAQVVKGLEATNVNIAWDLDYIRWGDNWQDKLQEELSRCQGYIILVGASGIRRWVKPELQYALRRHFEQDLPVFPLLLPGVRAGDLPPFLSLFHTRPLADPPEETNFAKLAAELQGKVESSDDSLEPDWQVEPFRGLEAYEECDAEFYFGRQVETVELLARLGPKPPSDYTRWLQVEGTSGVGKSSLIHAGLVPAVRNGWIEENASDRRGRWIVARMRPGNDPLLGLRVTLGNAVPEIKDDLRALTGESCDASSLTFALRSAIGDGKSSRILLVIDQFEELFTMTGDETRLRFDALAGHALADPDSPLHLVTGIRSDFMPRFTEMPKLRTLLNERAARYYLPAIGETGLRSAVTVPARRAGLRFSEGLADRIVEEGLEAGDAALVLVANVLGLLWQRARTRGDGVLRVEDYNELNGVAGALAISADTVIDELGQDRDAARRLLLALVNPVKDGPDTRKRISLGQALQAAGGGRLGERVLNRLSGLRDAENPDSHGPRLVVVSSPASEDGVEGESTVDLAHELLLREHLGVPYWKTLRDWVEKYRAELRRRESLQDRAAAWNEAGRPWRGGYLAFGQALREFRAIGSPDDVARDYLRACRQWRWMSGSAVIGAVAIAALIAGSFADKTLRLSVAYRLGLYELREPELVDVPPKKFQMGSSRDTDEQAEWHELPARMVTVSPFRVGKYEVTFAEYDQFASATGRPAPPEDRWGREKQPVINISWNEAVEYARWLSAVTGKRFRLPTEAEWEYSARGNTTGRYWWCPDYEPDCAVGSGAANCDGCGSTWDNVQPAPVGSFAANAFGLYDTTGNVWEWVQDCWHEDYTEAPVDGTAWEEAGNCNKRVLRGGSWNDRPRTLRSAHRTLSHPANSSPVVGFRIAQDLP